MSTATDLHPDSELIDQLGGPAKLASLLGYDMAGGVQRVHNWKSRGIPPRVRLERPDVFGAPKLPEQAGQGAEAAHG